MTSISINRGPGFAVSDFTTFLKFIIALQDPEKRAEMVDTLIAESDMQREQLNITQAALDKGQAQLVLDQEQAQREIAKMHAEVEAFKAAAVSEVERLTEEVRRAQAQVVKDRAAFNKEVDQANNALLSRERICQEKEADSSKKQVTLDRLLTEVEAERQRIAKRVAELEAAGVKLDV